MRSSSGAVAEVASPANGADLIVAFPHGFNVDADPETAELSPRLSILTKMCLDAALDIHQSHEGSTLLVPGETYREDPDFLNTPDLAREYLRGNANPVTLARLDDGRYLNNTYLQTQAIGDYIEGLAERPCNILAVTLNYHQKRVVRALSAYGITAPCITAEDVLHSRGITKYDQYLPAIAAGTRWTERLAGILTLGNRKGTIPNIITRRAGVRLVDIVDDGEGSYRLENTSATIKLAGLTRAMPRNAQEA